MKYEELLEKAKAACKNSYSPYSKFAVGACLLADDGRVYCGCNFENSSYGLSICAERNAVGSAVTEGNRKFKAIAIYSPQQDDCLPCGACRQVLAEFSKDMDIITEKQGEIKITKLTYLLPESFML